MVTEDARRSLPAVEKLVTRLNSTLPHALLVECARRAIDHARDRAEAGETPDSEAVIATAEEEVASMEQALLHRVVNATGVMVHTNLGRAPIGHDALVGAVDVGTGYSNLEFRLDTGERGSRHEHAGRLLALSAGAEAGIVVNNNAAAVLLVLAALARDREVVVSRGELVEIGGGFRIPEVLAESGARLVEVGTTNRTRRADYQAAIGPACALLLKVHTSNYRMVGFVESTPVRDLAGLGPPVVFDAGSGLLDAGTPWLPGGRPDWLADEPGVRQAIDDGAALVTFSGDKLLGGPQAGIVLGRRELIAQVARHPLARAVRADKLTLATLQGVALAYLSGSAASLPLWRMASTALDELRARAEALAARIPGAEVVDTEGVVGGGSLPGLTLPSAGVALGAAGRSVDRLADAIRRRAVVVRIEGDRIIADLRTVDPGDDGLVADALGGVAD